MIGTATEIIGKQFQFTNETINKLNMNIDKPDNAYMYIMYKLLENNSSSLQLSDINILGTILRCSDKTQSKYTNLQTVFKNSFLSKQQKDLYMTIFSESQRVYMGLNRFAFIWKYRKAKIGNTMDMMMNEINKTDKGVVEVYQQGALFLFRTSEVNKIIENSICDTEYMFASPKPVKNPFNNLPFTKANLYTMYFGIQKMTIARLPIIFYKYFLTEFNLKTFYEENQVLIRDKGIDDYLKNTEDDELYEDILDMLDYIQSFSRRAVKLDISEESCKCCIIKIMKPYLLLYYKHRHSLDKYKAKQTFYELRRKLFNLVDYNPCFGRRIHTQIPPGLDTKVRFKTSVNLNHPSSYCTFNRNAYSKTHLNIDFIHEDSYAQFENETIRPNLSYNRSRLQTFVHTAAIQNNRLNDNNNDESDNNSSDSDDETVINSYSSEMNISSETEDGEIVENENNSNEVSFELDYTGDLSMNDITSNHGEQVDDGDVTLDILNELINNMNDVRVRLESEISDDTTNNINSDNV